jgi:hypothetical protein
VFLSARDLAAAFQLDFKPDKHSEDANVDSSRAGATGFGTGGADTPLPWPPRRRRKRRVVRYVLLLLFLAAGGFAAYVAIDPHFRQQMLDWANARYMSLTGANLYPDIATQNGRPAPGAAAAPERTRQAQASTTAASIEKTPSTAPAPPDATASPRSSTQPGPRSAPPLPSSINVDIPPKQPVAGSRQTPVTSNRPAAAMQRPATRPIVIATQPAPPARPPGPAPAPRLTLQDAQQKAKAWYGQAFDADADGDLAKAASLYKKIMDELPEEIDGQRVWPSDVKLLYDQVKARAGK